MTPDDHLAFVNHGWHKPLELYREAQVTFDEVGHSTLWVNVFHHTFVNSFITNRPISIAINVHSFDIQPVGALQNYVVAPTPLFSIIILFFLTPQLLSIAVLINEDFTPFHQLFK